MSKKYINNSNTSSDNSSIAVINRVQPLEWVLPNKKEFPEWLHKTFIKYEIEEHFNPETPQESKPH